MEEQPPHAISQKYISGTVVIISEKHFKPSFSFFKKP